MIWQSISVAGHGNDQLVLRDDAESARANPNGLVAVFVAEKTLNVFRVDFGELDENPNLFPLSRDFVAVDCRKDEGNAEGLVVAGAVNVVAGMVVKVVADGAVMNEFVFGAVNVFVV